MAVGSCATSSCTSSSSVGCCTANNCNTALFCYVGQYNTITTATTPSTFIKTLCPLASNSYCRNTYTYSASTGVTVTGACTDATSCSSTTVTTSPANLASGVTCCLSSYCNFYSSVSVGSHLQATSLFGSFILLILLFIFLN